ncbi:cation:proton antiporter, partial [Bordetella holmesii]|nr:cation:proton antiporter [Bordetella holmesii]
MSDWPQLLPIYPIGVPLLAGAVMLRLADTRRRERAAIAVVSTVLQLASAIALLYLASGANGDWPDGIGVY